MGHVNQTLVSDTTLHKSHSSGYQTMHLSLQLKIRYGSLLVFGFIYIFYHLSTYVKCDNKCDSKFANIVYTLQLKATFKYVHTKHYVIRMRIVQYLPSIGT